MTSKMKMAIGVAALAGMTACATTMHPLEVRSLPKGAPSDIRSLLAQNPGRNVCVDYEAASDSCASLINAKISGDNMISRETGLVRLPEAGAAQRVEILTRSTIRDGQACAQAQDVTTEGRDEISGFLVEITRDLITQAGGEVCARYFESEDGYIVSATGADGKPFAQGDSRLRFVDGAVKLRVQ